MTTAAQAAKAYIDKAKQLALLYPDIKRDDYQLAVQWMVALNERHLMSQNPMVEMMQLRIIRK